MKIVIFGPQGSGKGTQAELIARRHGLPYISTGDIFRYHIKNKTELGQQVINYNNRGELVPDEVTNQIIKDRILQPDCEVGFVLDGYPRNQNQYQFLTELVDIDLAIVIELSDDEAIHRLANRLACKCGLSYHMEFNPPRTSDTCDKCGGQLFRREDDKPDAIKKRLEIYHCDTEPLFELYDRLGIVHRVDGTKDIAWVYGQIENIISKNFKSQIPNYKYQINDENSKGKRQKSKLQFKN